jgi:hypothetical protein
LTESARVSYSAPELPHRESICEKQQPIGPSAAGYAFDIAHSHTLPISASVCTSIIAACIIAATTRAEVPLHKADEAHGG